MKDVLADVATSESTKGTRIRLRTSYDPDLDLLLAVEFGEVIDGQLENETLEIADGVTFFRRPLTERVIGFAVERLHEQEADKLEWALLPEENISFDAPTLGVRDMTFEQVLIAAQATFDDYPTPDVYYFDQAVDAGEGDPEQAAGYWWACLDCGDMKAHFGLGYTLYELGEHHRAYAHLRAYTEISPNNSWAWLWRGKACEAIGERREAADCYRRAIELEKKGSFETDAEELLEELENRDA